MKKIDKLVIRDFIPPYLMAFFVAEFVLVMQFLWKYIDEIIGKGFSLGVLLELIFYFAVRIIPEAVPVSILIASVMVFGNLAEKYELSSMKSSGISLTRIMAGAILISIVTASFSLVASNYLKPRANYKFLYRFNAIRKQKPALSIEEGVFNKDFRNIVVRVDKKAPNGIDIEDVLIFDHSSEDKRNVNIMSAERGKMYSGGESNDFIMELEDGEQFRELKHRKPRGKIYPLPFVRTKFKSWTKIFDMSEFELEAENLNMTRKKYDLLNANQLRVAIDSFDRAIVSNTQSTHYDFSDLIEIDLPQEDSIQNKNNLPDAVKQAIRSQDALEKKTLNPPLKKKKQEMVQLAAIHDSVRSIVQLLPRQEASNLLKTSKYISERNHDNVLRASRHEDSLRYARSLYVLRLNQQYSWAVICIVFLFIGAPLGSIVKKGGYGYPLLISITFFMLFIILNIMGEKLNKSQSIDPLLAAWMPNIVILPIAILLTYKALNDSDFSWLQSRLKLLFFRFFPKKD